METTNKQPLFTPVAAAQAGFALLQQHFAPFLAFAAIGILYSLIASAISALVGNYNLLNSLWSLANMVLNLIFVVAGIRLLLQLIDNKMIDWKSLFKFDGWLLLHVAIAYFLMIVATLAGMILLIVPGVIIGLGFSQSLFLAVEERATGLSALSSSWALTKGSRGRIFLSQLLFVGLMIVPFVIVAILFAVAPIFKVTALVMIIRLAAGLVGLAGIVWAMAVAFSSYFAQIWIYRRLRSQGTALPLIKIQN